jgi:hypothetical protein
MMITVAMLRIARSLLLLNGFYPCLIDLQWARYAAKSTELRTTSRG